MKNWSGYLQWQPEQIFRPTSIEEISLIIQQAVSQKKKVRLIGTGHSFTPLSKTDEFLVSLDDYQGIVHIDPTTQQATVKAGTKLHTLNKLLHEQGLALENLGDIDVQSIAGAISTGTHGTGTAFGNLCTQVRKITFINGLGELISCAVDDQPDLFKAVVLSMGLFGVLTEITLQCVPSYHLELNVQKRRIDEVIASYQEYNARNRHFEFYWFPNTPYVMTKELNLSNAPASSGSFKEYLQEVLLENYALKAVCELSYRIPSLTHRISRFAASTIDDFRKVKRSFEVFSTTRIVRFNEMEYNVPIEAYTDVKKEMISWINTHNLDVMFPIENRFVKGDDIYLSPAYLRDSAYIAVHTYNKKKFHNYFAAIEAIFKAYEGRPHWGKIHTRTAEEFARLYPKFDDFSLLRDQHDPEQLFMSPYMETIIGKSLVH